MLNKINLCHLPLGNQLKLYSGLLQLSQLTESEGEPKQSVLPIILLYLLDEAHNCRCVFELIFHVWLLKVLISLDVRH